MHSWCDQPPARRLILDIGGEGRYAKAWNLNPSPVKTIGSARGEPIPRHIAGRAEAIPLPDASVRIVIAERIPLRVAALQEIARIIMPGGVIILRHVPIPHRDPHSLARQILPGVARQRFCHLGKQLVQETRFRYRIQ